MNEISTASDELLDPEDVLDDPMLENGYSPPDHAQGLDSFGTTAAEQLRGESLAQRLAQEEPDPALADDGGPAERLPDTDDGDVGTERAGRLVDFHDGTGYTDVMSTDVGIDGAGSSAEEAAMHVLPDKETPYWEDK